ncbi:MAG: amidohydrolase family protein [Balneolaceae bacterium]|nr:amidohydrolase family protein [Balneolaceae bacterium]MCH8547405.1 amidohydrolase family protein [Balneolaceae bacterium]
MKTTFKYLLLSLLTLALFVSCDAPTEGDVVVIENVNVLSMESDEILENQSIIISDGRITWMGSATEAHTPPGATIITGDFYVMPGLAEMHAHIPPERQGSDYMEAVLGLYLSQGLTTIRGMLGEPAHLEFREKAAAGEISSPRVFTSGPSFSGNSVSEPDEARQRVRDQKEAGYDLLKFHPGMSLEVFEATVDEANQQGIEFAGHISLPVGLERSLEAGKASIDHLDRYMEFLAGDAAERDDPPIIYFGYDLTNEIDEDLIDEAARKTVEAGVWNVPTNTLLVNVFSPDYSIEEMRSWPGMEFIPEQTVNGWADYVEDVRTGSDYDEEQARRFLEIRNRITKALHDHDAGLLLGADAPQIFNPPGYSAHRELALLVEAGLTPFEALKTGTVNVGVYLNEEGETGMVAPGYRADLIFLSSNPLESIPFHDAIEGVMKDGKFYDAEELEALREKMRDSL